MPCLSTSPSVLNQEPGLTRNIISISDYSTIRLSKEEAANITHRGAEKEEKMWHSVTSIVQALKIKTK